MLPLDLETRTSEHVEALRREAASRRQTRHLTWQHDVATFLRRLAERLEPQAPAPRGTMHPART